MQFQTKIRNLKTQYPREFWNILKSETNYKSTEIDCATFTEFIEHFCELNGDLMFSGIVRTICDTSTSTINNAINQPFTIDEIKSSIKKLKNNKTSGVDNVVNEFFKYVHTDCIQLTVDFFNIVLNTRFGFLQIGALVPFTRCIKKVQSQILIIIEVSHF